jgi:hypothetical protein
MPIILYSVSLHRGLLARFVFSGREFLTQTSAFSHATMITVATF